MQSNFRETGDANRYRSGWILARVACQDVLHLHKPEPVRFYSKASHFVWNQMCGNKMPVVAVNT